MELGLSSYRPADRRGSALQTSRCCHAQPLYDRADSDLTDQMAGIAFLKSTTSQVSDAIAILEWVEESPTPASPMRSASVEMAKASIANAVGRFADGEAHARRAIIVNDREETRRDSPVVPLVLLAMAQNQLGDSHQAVDLLQRRAAQIVVPRWDGPVLQFLTCGCRRLSRER